MHAIATAGAGYLMAVLWFDLMFDIQVRGHSDALLPEPIRASLSAYYRRVTTEAFPMNRMVALTMLLTLAALTGELASGMFPWWVIWPSLIATAGAISLAGARTVRNAKRLGRGEDSAETQTRLARSIYKDHLLCFGAITLLLVLQVVA